MSAIVYTPVPSCFPTSSFCCLEPLPKRRKSITLSRQPKPRPSHRHPKNPTFSPVLTTIVSQDPNAMNSTRPSPAPWADGPYPLIPARQYKGMTAAIFVATEMALIHNVLLRGLNSILRQAPYVPDSLKPGYNPQDVEDLLFYAKTWCKTIMLHHRIEETVFYPSVEEETGIVGLMDDLEVEHEEWVDGVTALQLYLERTIEKPEQYRWATMRTMINSFAPALTNHLYSEIDFLVGLDKFNCEGLRKRWYEAENAATKVKDSTTMYDLFPFVLCNWDSTFEGRKSLPDVAKPIMYAIKHFFGKKHAGAWRFNSCDFSGRPQPLQMLPENREI